MMRPKLFYMAVFSEDFTFVNQFEFKVILGDTAGSGIGADGTTFFRIKNFQANFNLWIIRLFDRITAEDA